MARPARLALAAALLGVGGFAGAHESRPLYVEIDERSAELVEVRWRAPRSVPDFDVPEVLLPAACTAVGPATRVEDPGAHARRQLHRCEGGLVGGEIAVRYPVLNPSVATLVRLERSSGEVHTALLGPGENRWPVPARETRSRVAREYTALGTRHILEGADHLLFVACLILVARSWRKILVTITGFTIAHSITLALAALGWVRVPVPPVEAAIALSIVFVAREIARPARDTLTYRHPVSVSASFGLLHGLGFAAVLSEVGLPQIEIPVALFFFNLGVEIGQILFVVGLLAILALVRLGVRSSLARRGAGPPAAARLEPVAAYAAGSLAAFWTVERVASFWA
ncbi:MAG: HupE/UreJ family protein [Deltaproteobacteria bacterium]|nr:MAG: HupE/UreJ family protein [Deltaproteobacteria bacterium]